MRGIRDKKERRKKIRETVQRDGKIERDDGRDKSRLT